VGRGNFLLRFHQVADFTVAEESPTEMQIGEPVRAVLQANETKTGVAFDLRFLGSLGESVQIMRGHDRPRAPRLQVASVKGTFYCTNTFEYG